MGLISRVSSRTYRENTKIKMATKNLSQDVEIEGTLKRISGHKGVLGYIIINQDGIPIKTTLDNSTTTMYAQLLLQLTKKSRSVVRDLDPTDNLRFLRLKSQKHEIMIAPEKDYILVVIQDPQQ